MTGSSGPKAGHVVARELANRHRLDGVDLLPGAHTRWCADIADVMDWQEWLNGIDAVVHFAALHAPHRETHSRAEFYRTNVEATSRLLDAARMTGVKRFILASTTSVYGRAMRTKGIAAWVTEDMVPEPEDIYDETKLAAEALCRDAFSADFVTAALRFSRSFPEPPPLMALYRLYRGVDARDVAQAFELALDRPLERFEVFNISGDTPFHHEDCKALFREPLSVLRLRAPDLVAEYQRRGWTLPLSIDRVYVIDKAKAQLGFAPRYGWREFLETMDRDGGAPQSGARAN
jgi:nucleoside-diphosphate-sugar epimerase